MWGLGSTQTLPLLSEGRDTVSNRPTSHKGREKKKKKQRNKERERGREGKISSTKIVTIEKSIAETN